MFEIDEYLGKIKENLPHGESELMHRPALEYLLSSMKEDIDSNVRIITEKEYSNQANNENYGTPDFSVIKDSLTLGLVENKRVGLISEGYKLFMENKKNKAQIEKYFNISNNIILTDYLNFYLLTKEEEKIKVEKSVTLCSKNDLKSKKKPKIDSKDTKNLKELFALFFTKTPESINDAKAFAKALALPASSLKDELLVLGERDESGTIVNEYINNL